MKGPALLVATGHRWLTHSDGGIASARIHSDTVSARPLELASPSGRSVADLLQLLTLRSYTLIPDPDLLSFKFQLG